MTTTHQTWHAPSVDDVRSSAHAREQVAAYLARFGYLSPPELPAQRSATDAPTDLSSALSELQRRAGLEPTGEYDSATAALLQQPRCGLPDGRGLDDFATAGTRWGHRDITYRFDGFCAELTQAQVREAVRTAFARWSEVTPLSFREVAAGASADIRIRWTAGDHGDGNAFDGIGTVLAHAFFPPPNNGELAGDAHFDEAETWSAALVQQVALHEFGHSLGLRHSEVADAVMWPFITGRTTLHSDDVAGIRSLYGSRLPAWQHLDDNPRTVEVVADGTALYQRHDTGRIWRYTGTPMTGWQLLDANPATVQIVASGGRLYQRHADGRIWRYTGTPMTGWQLLDANPRTVSIVADGAELYQRHDTGRIWRYTGTPMTGWQLLDANPATVQIVASGGGLYQRHAGGRIWRYTGTPMTGWQLLDANPATVDVVAGGTQLYQRHSTGHVWRYTGTPMTGWQRLDDNPATAQLVAAGPHLYQVHGNGRIWRYTGTPLTGWQLLDENPATRALAASADGRLYQRHVNGHIWRLAG